MAVEGDKIEYRDLISPDDSINELISQLEQLNKSYGVMINAVRAGAERIVHSMKQVSGATSEGRAKIDEATGSANRLKKAQNELAFALTETGQKVAWLKAQTSDVNKVTVEQQRTAKMLAGSYDALRQELNENIRLWKALSDVEREDAAMGGQVLSTITSLNSKLAELDSQVKPVVESMTRLQKAEQELAFLQSEEGKQLMTINAQIRELKSEYSGQKDEVDALAKAKQKLVDAQSDENRQLQLLKQQTDEANKIAKLEVQLTNSKEGSYDRLSAQYQLNKIALNKMSKEERNLTKEGQELEKQTEEIYKEMVLLQEATGNHRLSVGNYAKAWNGLGMSVNQIVRELPSAAMGFNTFILAISNNVPILIDEIQRVKAANEIALKQGKPTQNVLKTITSALFGWQTALIIGITVLTMHGDTIVAWAKKLITGRVEVMSLAKAYENIAKELESTNDSYGDNIVTLKKLQTEWKDLKTTAEKNQWIKDNASEFNQLDINITNVNDAETAFVDFTDDVIKALQLRAKAAAAMKLASERYEKALLKKNAAEKEGAIFEDDKFTGVGFSKKSSTEERLKTLGEFAFEYITSPSKWTYSAEELAGTEFATKTPAERLAEESEAFKAEADNYFNIAAEFNKKAKETLEAAGLSEAHKKGGKGREKQIIDLSDKIAKDNLKARKKYEASTTRLIEDELEQRKAKAADSRRAESRELILQLANNERLLKANESAKNGIFEMGGKKYKQLTEDQVNVVKEQQELIRGTILKNNEFIRKEDEKFALEEQKRALEIAQETISLRLEAVKKGSAEELNLRLQAIETERKQALITNRLLPEGLRQDESVINASYNAKSQRAQGDIFLERFEQNQALKKAEFDTRKHISEDITAFELQQEKELWLYKIALAEAGLLDWSQAQIDAAKQTVDGINKELNEITGINGIIGSIAKRGIGGTLLAKMGFDDEGIQAFSDATNTIISNLQQIMQAEVQLAEAAVEAAQKRADSAKSALDAEIEARNNGYANNVASARKEYELEKKKVADNQKLLQQAKRRQEALDTALQTASLITATANIWKAMSGVPFIGPALAITAIAGMWASFAAAKIKARQVAAAGQEYGEGGLEFLEGGSHASGNDIDLATKNKRGKNMRAEGGEALAIINKRNTKRYRKQLPSIIESLNKGTFEDKYLRAFDKGSQLSLRVESNRVDLSKIEGYVEKISNRDTTQRVSLSDGSILVVRKNVRRIIKSY